MKRCFSALQRAEIAEIYPPEWDTQNLRVSVLFNEPKLLKLVITVNHTLQYHCFSALQRAEIAEISTMSTSVLNDIGFSALQRAEIAEIVLERVAHNVRGVFQCSSTSRNC